MLSECEHRIRIMWGGNIWVSSKGWTLPTCRWLPLSDMQVGKSCGYLLIKLSNWRKASLPSHCLAVLGIYLAMTNDGPKLNATNYTQ